MRYFEDEFDKLLDIEEENDFDFVNKEIQDGQFSFFNKLENEETDLSHIKDKKDEKDKFDYIETIIKKQVDNKIKDIITEKGIISIVKSAIEEQMQSKKETKNKISSSNIKNIFSELIDDAKLKKNVNNTEELSKDDFISLFKNKVVQNILMEDTKVNVSNDQTNKEPEIMFNSKLSSSSFSGINEPSTKKAPIEYSSNMVSSVSDEDLNKNHKLSATVKQALFNEDVLTERNHSIKTPLTTVETPLSSYKKYDNKQSQVHMDNDLSFGDNPTNAQSKIDDEIKSQPVKSLNNLFKKSKTSYKEKISKVDNPPNDLSFSKDNDFDGPNELSHSSFDLEDSYDSHFENESFHPEQEEIKTDKKDNSFKNSKKEHHRLGHFKSKTLFSERKTKHPGHEKKINKKSGFSIKSKENEKTMEMDDGNTIVITGTMSKMEEAISKKQKNNKY